MRHPLAEAFLGKPSPWRARAEGPYIVVEAPARLNDRQIAEAIGAAMGAGVLTLRVRRVRGRTYFTARTALAGASQ